jgi:O-antigen ligase
MAAEKLFRLSDRLTGVLICLMVIFTPWAFGTTEPWSIRIMNAAGFLLGALLLVKGVIRLVSDYRPERWGEASSAVRALTAALAALTVLTLLWCVVSAWNASANYSAVALQFEYREYIRWLPHSFDAQRSWRLFWNYAALACAFWAIRDWLLIRTGADHDESRKRRNPPSRLQVLVWTMTINAALVGIEGVFQRLDGGGKLLWLVQPTVNREAESQFGPYAYRSNAAQFLNLIWPVALGLWAILHRRHAPGKRATHHMLLSCVMVIAACPLVSDSRAGAIVGAGCLTLSGLLLVLALSNQSWIVRAAPGLFGIATLALGLNLGWDKLSTRMKTLENDLGSREETYNTARKIAADYPWFGTGPGTFDPVFQLYRSSPDEYWPGQLHNDWLETLITFGRIGFAMIFCALLLVMGRWFIPGGGASTHWALPAFIWLSLGGCLLHGRFDFPFQVYSVLFVFLVNCAMLSTICRRT